MREQPQLVKQFRHDSTDTQQAGHAVPCMAGDTRRDTVDTLIPSFAAVAARLRASGRNGVCRDEE